MMFAKLRSWWKASSAEVGGPAVVRLFPADRFRSQLDIERNRADRSGQPFALVVFRFNDEHDPERFRLAGRLEQRLRAVDHAGWLDGERLGVILTNTQAAGAQTFVENILAGSEWIACRSEVHIYPSADSAQRPQSGSRANGERIVNGASGRSAVTATAVMASSAVSAASAVSVEERVATAFDLMQELCDAATNNRPGACAASADATVEHDHGAPGADSFFVSPLPAWKRAIDIVGAIVALAVFSPVLLLAAVLVRLTSRGPVIFRQQRVGLGGKLFTMNKFRTMYVDAEARQAELRQFSEQDGPAFKMTNDPRITRVGRYLRKSCIDELPQLWNVLKGDMTLVGPRPLDAKETSQIEGWQRRRIDVTPGLTCIWQIHGKSRVPFVEWMRMDIRYLKARSIRRDLGLIARTVRTVLLHRGSG